MDLNRSSSKKNIWQTWIIVRFRRQSAMRNQWDPRGMSRVRGGPGWSGPPPNEPKFFQKAKCIYVFLPLMVKKKCFKITLYYINFFEICTLHVKEIHWYWIWWAIRRMWYILDIDGYFARWAWGCFYTIDLLGGQNISKCSHSLKRKSRQRLDFILIFGRFNTK